MFRSNAGIAILKFDRTLTGQDDNFSNLPLEFSLGQNYPNPFNPITVIGYRLSKVSDVQLVVYDLLGRVVRILVNERQSPGSYEVKFSAKGASPPHGTNEGWRGSASGGDGSGLSSGVYLYRLTAGNLVQTRKMILMR
jgi:hypothetical protein